MATFDPDLEVNFDLLQVGLDGHIEVIPPCGDSKPRLPLATVPVGLPPVLPTLTDALNEFLTHPEKIPIHNLEKSQKFWPRKQCPESLYTIDVCPLQTKIVVDRNPTTGELLGFKEEFLNTTGTSAANSTSLKRPPGPPSDSIRGTTTNYPFWPGGLEEPNMRTLKGSTESDDINFDEDLLVIPPGFSTGMQFDKKKLGSLMIGTGDITQLNLADILASADDIELLDDDVDNDVNSVKEDQKQEERETEHEEKGRDTAAHESIDNIIKLESRSGLSEENAAAASLGKDGWAIMLDSSSPISDFYKRVPDMAHKWDFELDVFQKQAILCLENHQNVFVAAHTSAGKTAVAEYAVALSMKHMTKTIYTSPIKALSNQKYRDFKETFKEVGLITGDVQISPEAPCLIMTTEILRSMLYNGSDVIRDLEWVIFDEVHYINDAERGVVWEEVLIMLPKHVKLVLLSATVPNTREFASWIGRTKQKPVHVVSTQKRPVPLEHFLYTGNSAKTSNELFLILDAKKNFVVTGYNKALNAKLERSNKYSQSYGAKGTRGGNPHQDRNMWLSLIEMLRKKEKLPAVAFIFSRKRIDETSQQLHNVDLLTSKERSEVHVFFHKCIAKLKGNDRDLPQVKQMQELLKRGLGVHHSGVLPLLKEVVEMLFHRGLVKILFATETFAMGVNMPARLVIFDSIRKHDGKVLRDLLPSEYIQMAGRAGRRGLDATGTVIILCKGDVPEMSDLHKIMLGKPTLLQSQFRLTYSMILNLMRVEQIRVEDMMKHSFSEYNTQKDMQHHQMELKEVTENLATLPVVLDYSGDLEAYYNACQEYYDLRSEVHKTVMSHPQTIRALCPGRVIVTDTRTHYNVLGVVLQSGRDRTYTVLTVCGQDAASGPDTDQSDPSSPRPLLANQLYLPDGPCGHRVVTLKTSQITSVTTYTVKVNSDKITNDYNKRQQPRFRNDPPGQSASVATQELVRLIESHPDGLLELDPMRDLHIQDMDLVEQFHRINFLRSSLLSAYKCVHDPNFTENFEKVRHQKQLEEKKKKLLFLLSDASLQLLPEFQLRVKVLQELNYVDAAGTVQLKGRVACEISGHELIITELIFHNTLTPLHPTEIAAVLSSVVFQGRRQEKGKEQSSLTDVKENFLEIATKIGELQHSCGLDIQVEDYVDEFNFDLMDIVFEWARGVKSFAEIMQLTSVQEGIIVRCIQRLHETLRDVRNAARIIGDPILYQKAEEAATLIKRDIVFAASLYVQ